MLLPLVVFVIKVKAAPFYPETPANTYLMDYSYPVPDDYYRNAAHEYRSASLLSAMSSTLTNQFQAIAGWQLSKMRKKWIKVICFFTPKPPKTSDKPKQKKCKKTINLPFPSLRENPQKFDVLNDWEDWEEEEDDPEMFIPVVAYRNDAASDPVEAIPSYKSPAVIPDDGTNPTSSAVMNTDDDVVEEKSAAIMTSLANSQMAVTIWKWNLLLCLVNPSCPNVVLPPIKQKNRSDYYPSSPANLEMLRALNQYVNFPNWY